MSKKMSEIMKEMAMILLVNPEGTPSSETAHTALLLANVAWNRAVGYNSDIDYTTLIRMFESANPDLWTELKYSDCEEAIGCLVNYKKMYYPDDNREIKVCGMQEENVHVEWVDRN